MIQASLDFWWHQLAGESQVFWGIAIVSSALFIVQFILSILGLGGSDLDAEGDWNFHHDFGLHLFSLRGILAGLMLFGWTGVAIITSGGNVIAAFAWAFVAGIVALIGVAYLLRLFLALQDAGHTVKIIDALDKVGEVYLRIPPNLSGVGKVHLIMENSHQEIDAMTTASYPIATGTKVRVVKIREDNILLVQPDSETIIHSS